MRRLSFVVDIGGRLPIAVRGRDQVVLVVFIRRCVAKGIGDLGVVAHAVIGIVCGIALSILGRSGAAHRIIAGGAAAAF